MSTALRLSAIIPLIIAAVACSTQGEYTDYADISPTGWAYTDTLNYGPVQSDSPTPGDLSIDIRHNSDYAFSNLWLEVSYTDKGQTHTDTLNLRLADVYGRWTGKGFGAIRQIGVKIADGITPSQGSSVRIRHIMRLDTLRGIESVGITFSPK